MEDTIFEATLGLSPFRRVVLIQNPNDEESLGELYYSLDIHDTLELHT